jgi:hypothetical protein
MKVVSKYDIYFIGKCHLKKKIPDFSIKNKVPRLFPDHSFSPGFLVFQTCWEPCMYPIVKELI